MVWGALTVDLAEKSNAPFVEISVRGLYTLHSGLEPTSLFGWPCVLKTWLHHLAVTHGSKLRNQSPGLQSQFTLMRGRHMAPKMTNCSVYNGDWRPKRTKGSAVGVKDTHGHL